MKYTRRPQVWFGSLILFLTLGCSLSFGASSTNTASKGPGPAKLVALAKQRFDKLSAAERKLLEAAADADDTDAVLSPLMTAADNTQNRPGRKMTARSELSRSHALFLMIQHTSCSRLKKCEDDELNFVIAHSIDGRLVAMLKRSATFEGWHSKIVQHARENMQSEAKLI